MVLIAFSEFSHNNKKICRKRELEKLSVHRKLRQQRAGREAQGEEVCGVGAGSRDGKRYVGDCSCATTRRIGAVTSSRQLENVKTLLAVTRSGRQRREDLDIMVIPWLLLLEMGLYASSFVCGIVTASSLTIVQGSFGGLCMLYGTVTHNSSSDSILVQTSSSPSLCYFVSAISVCVAVFCFSISLYWIYTCCLDGGVNRERLWLNMTLVVCGVFLFFLLVTGCVLKVGRDFLCDSVLHAVPNVTRCEQAQSRTWISPYTGTQIYTGLYNAGTAVWVNFFFWILIGILVVIQRGQGSDSRMMTPSETDYLFSGQAQQQ